MNNYIEINGKKFEVIDALEHITLTDSFVLKNKMGKGHGEAKLYVGQANKRTSDFFNNFSRKCIFLKNDLKKYLEDARLEYTNSEQEYKNKKDLPKDLEKYKEEISKITEEVIPFSIQHIKIKGPRVYIRSKDKIYQLMRKIALPQISYITILKLKSENKKIIYYFHMFLDYFESVDHPYLIREQEKKIIQDKKIKVGEKERLMKARIGQGPYRESVLKECPICPITLVSDERILTASHIKPWAHSENGEKTDPKNGLMFTPTFHKLFDLGFISFNDDRSILVSPYISPMNIKRLNLVPGKTYPLPLEGRIKYLNYHRKKIFKK